MTNNFIAAFPGLYLLAAHSHFFQLLLFSFWVEHVENGLRTMSNKTCYHIGKKGYCKVENMTVQLSMTTENAFVLMKTLNLFIKSQSVVVYSGLAFALFNNYVKKSNVESPWVVESLLRLS